MPSLKDLRNRIDSVKSTKKITQAMKMVAASKLKKAQEVAEKGRNYSNNMNNLVLDLSSNKSSVSHPLLDKKTNIKKYLLIAITSDRGLCGGFNSSIIRAVRQKLIELENDSNNVEIFCIGIKGYEALSVIFPKNKIYKSHYSMGSNVDFAEVDSIAQDLIAKFYDNEFDTCHLFYSHFKSVIAQIVTKQTLIPYQVDSPVGDNESDKSGLFFEYEPDEHSVLSELLPKNVTVQIYRAILEARASEQGARMTAMDNATRNAGEMIDSLTLSYNRQRQAMITKELIEIISGAEAL